MKTDDRATRQRDEVDGDEAKVVRLSDWLAPDDELVPFGPRAHARATARQPAEERVNPGAGVDPTAASGFWDGDPSVHTAVPGPELFDEPGAPTNRRQQYRRRPPVWRPALPSLHPFGWGLRTREWLADLTDGISRRWAAIGIALIALALTVLVITVSGSSSDPRGTVAQAGIGRPSPIALNPTLREVGTATPAAAVADLRRLPPVDTADRTIGTAAQHAQALQARHRRHVVVASTAVASASTTAAIETTTSAPAPAETTTASAPAPAETTPAPSETEPAQSTSNPPVSTGGGGGSSGGGVSSGSSKQSTFGASGSLGPGSSPNG